MKFKNKILITLSAIVLILVITNPTRKNFLEYLGLEKDNNMRYLKKQNNFLIFSVFVNDETEDNQKYFAICKNFIRIK